MKSFIDRIKTDKVLFFLSVLIIGLFLVLIIRITYSYLAASINEAGNNVTMGSDKTDELKFIKGDNLVLNATSTTLPEGGANYVDSTTYSASLKANSTNNTANYTYYVYFNIPTNTINYIEENTPEVILTISQGENTITNISGLTYGTYNGVAGFDITNKTGLFTVASNYAISSTSSSTATIQDWTFTLTYLNQGYDQSANYGNSMNVEIIMSKEERTVTLADYVISQYTGTDGENGLYYHDGIGDYTNAAEEAGDNSYRYSGYDPNNYVCFGSDETICPDDNLYRIIGIFNDPSNYLVKLIKTSSIGTYFWSDSEYATSEAWSTSPLNNDILNNEFLNNLGDYAELIYEYNWQVGGMEQDVLNLSNKNVHDYELGNYSSNVIFKAKVGLMYVSDYIYSSNPNKWSNIINDYDYSGWMGFINVGWTITPALPDNVFGISPNPYSGFNRIDYELASSEWGMIYQNPRDTFPVFYLNPDVTYISGTGTESDPFRIA